MFASAAIIMLFGMAFVFVFLIIQVFLTYFFAKLAAKYSHLLPDTTKPQKKPAAASVADDTATVAVIAAALGGAGRI